MLPADSAGWKGRGQIQDYESSSGASRSPPLREDMQDISSRRWSVFFGLAATGCRL